MAKIFNFIIARTWIATGADAGTADRGVAILPNRKVYEGTEEEAIAARDTIREQTGNIDWQVYPIDHTFEGEEYKLIIRADVPQEQQAVDSKYHKFPIQSAQDLAAARKLYTQWKEIERKAWNIYNKTPPDNLNTSAEERSQQSSDWFNQSFLEAANSLGFTISFNNKNLTYGT